ncbi:MAG: putative F420-dependent enzyme [Frankiales bacterium]|nr:putative F420-dependent enzyme [Frankiales bacterium]
MAQAGALRQSDGMDLDAARDHVREHHHAVLCTIRSDGTPQLSPVLAAVDAEGRVVVSTRNGLAKVGNIRRDPRVWLCVFADEFYGDWVQLGGRAEIVALPEALEPLVDYYRRIAGEHPQWAAYREAMVADERVLVRITLDRAGPG